jgi:hypothetical protein
MGDVPSVGRHHNKKDGLSQSITITRREKSGESYAIIAIIVWSVATVMVHYYAGSQITSIKERGCSSQ